MLEYGALKFFFGSYILCKFLQLKVELAIVIFKFHQLAYFFIEVNYKKIKKTNLFVNLLVFTISQILGLKSSTFEAVIKCYNEKKIKHF